MINGHHNHSGGRYIDLLTDFGFKKLFGTELNKALLIDFLNLILPEPHQIKDLTYKPSEHLASNPFDRAAIFDIHCEGPTGEQFIVEVQKAKQNYFKDRSVYYSTFPIQEQGKKGEWDYKLSCVYTVGILDFIFDDHKDDDNFLHYVELTNQDCEVFYDKLKYIYIELPKFKKTENELEDHFDKWLYVFRHLSELSDLPSNLQEKVFEQLFERAEIAKFTPKERKAYQASLKSYRDSQNIMNTKLEEGMEKGRKEGIEEGIKKTAKNMKLEGIPKSQIAKCTGLSEKEIDEL